jgi:mono/diheme cytochrome c family protein
MSRSSSVVRSFACALLVFLAACGGEKPDADDDAKATTTVASAQSAGEKIYQQRCQSCHQPNGEGTTGVYPALAGSEYATAADAGVPIRVVMHGLQGPITVKGAEYNSLMPAYGIGIVMSDEEVAAIVTYIRSSWGNSASAVTAHDVHEVREATKDHTGAMTADLLKPLLARK